MYVYRIEVNLDALGYQRLLHPDLEKRPNATERLDEISAFERSVADVLATLQRQLTEPAESHVRLYSPRLPSRIDGRWLESPPLCEAKIMHGVRDTKLGRIVSTCWIVIWVGIVIGMIVFGDGKSSWHQGFLTSLACYSALMPILYDMFVNWLKTRG